MKHTGEPTRSATPEGDPDPGGWRMEFPILERTAYLNSNSLGALSKKALARRREFEEGWNRLGAHAWYELWLDALGAVRAAFGRTIGASPGEIALMPSVSAALAAVAGSLEPGPRNRIVLTELDFPTLAYQFLSRRERGLEVIILESPDGVRVPLEAFSDAVDERTALVATSHVFFTTGAVQDVPALARIAHDAGALLLLDAYQSNGQMPIDAPTWGVDFLVSGALKWLLGGPGLAYLYVDPEIDLRPTTLSWFGVEDQFDFDLRRPVPRRDARRFELGTPAVGAAFTSRGGLEVIEEVGIPWIRDRNRWLADDLRARLRTAGWDVHEAPESGERSALVLVPHPNPARAVTALAEADVIVDHRDRFVRLSPHFYNSVEDNVRAVAALGDGPPAP